MVDWKFFLRSKRSGGILPAVLISCLLWACGVGGSVGGGGTVTGFVVDGPVDGAVINCFQVDPTGQPTGTAINADVITTALDGSFTLTAAVNVTGPVMCTSTGGTDTVTTATAPDLSVLIPDGVTSGATVTANLTPLTTVATTIVQNGGTATATIINQTLLDVATAFGLAGSDLLTLVPSDTDTATPAQIKYQNILDDLSAIAAAKGFTNLITALADDLADGVLDGLKNGTQVKIGITPLDQLASFTTLLDTVIEMGFTPDPGSCTTNCVSMVRNATKSTAGVLAVDIKANNIIAGHIFGAEFDVDIGNTSVTLWNGTLTTNCPATNEAGCAKGNFLEQASSNVLYEVALQQGTTNKLVVGASEQAGDLGATGSGTIITLKFQKVGISGMSSTLSFSNNSLEDPSLNVISVTWSGGTITIP